MNLLLVIFAWFFVFGILGSFEAEQSWNFSLSWLWFKSDFISNDVNFRIEFWQILAWFGLLKVFFLSHVHKNIVHIRIVSFFLCTLSG